MCNETEDGRSESVSAVLINYCFIGSSQKSIPPDELAPLSERNAKKSVGTFLRACERDYIWNHVVAFKLEGK